MKQRETQMVARTVIVARSCDWCGCDLPLAQEKYQRYPETDIDSHISKMLTEEAYGDGWSVEDLCIECGNKLADLLEANGIKVFRYDF